MYPLSCINHVKKMFSQHDDLYVLYLLVDMLLDKGRLLSKTAAAVIIIISTTWSCQSFFTVFKTQS